jgi:hypothetical protein
MTAARCAVTALCWNHPLGRRIDAQESACHLPDTSLYDTGAAPFV